MKRKNKFPENRIISAGKVDLNYKPKFYGQNDHEEFKKDFGEGSELSKMVMQKSRQCGFTNSFYHTVLGKPYTRKQYKKDQRQRRILKIKKWIRGLFGC